MCSVRLVSLLKPLDGSTHSLFKVHLRLPFKLVKYFDGRNLFARIVARSSRDMLDADPSAEHLVYSPCDILNRNLLRPFKVIDLILRTLAHRQDVRPRQIVNVDVVAILATVALNHNRLAFERLTYKDRDDQFFTHARPVRDAVPQ